YKVLDYALKKYGDKEEYLWPKFPRNAVCRRKDNQKWYFAILSVNGTKLGLKDEIIEVINLRAPKDEVPELLKLKHIYPAYHMNKKSWITIVLDGSCTLEEIFARIDKSYELVK
ncbi:MAG: MmcQ/YjbR family DNA-binding protein, partial [Elusimicrobiaceae bacterium]|nr:MmcQ/YjbR family DNA-binding protein [Elusimicrobiaceae bacterium]